MNANSDANAKEKGDFTPVNGLEEQLRRVMTDKHTPLWDFYTPLAAARLWLLVPEGLEPDDLGPGKAIPICTWTFNEAEHVSLYTSRQQAEQVMNLWPERPLTCVAAKGHGLLRLMMMQPADHLWLNLFVPGAQYTLDPDMVDLLLERPEPPDSGLERLVRVPEDDPGKFLGPVRDLLARDAAVRAAWIFEAPASMDKAAPASRGDVSYELALLMQDPDDDHLLRQVELMAKALTPVQMEWTVKRLRGDDASLRELAERQPPFYAARGFLQGG